MKLMSPFAGPCSCTCHDKDGTECPTHCCHYHSVMRTVAESMAEEVCKQHLAGEQVESILEIDGHEHNLVALSDLTYGNGVKTLMKATDLSPDCEERINEEFMPAVRTLLECCAPAARMQSLLDQSEEFRHIATVRSI
ncbi:MAG: hypothetical protein JWO84_518 [Parcubacteria group bacterium]|nr:hypothetical protein [Parcubacteria group bacterium]